jgi:hypothetical protein
MSNLNLLITSEYGDLARVQELISYDVENHQKAKKAKNLW